MEAAKIDFELAVPLDQLPAQTPFETGADILKLLDTVGDLEQFSDEKPRRVDWRLREANGNRASIQAISEPDVANRAALSVVRGFAQAEQVPELPRTWNTVAGNRASRVATRLGETPETGLRLIVTSDLDDAEARVTRRASRNLHAASSLRYTSYGSVTGTLGRITAYRSRRASLWADATDRRVDVWFGLQHLDDMREAWAHAHVEVTGVIHENAAGQVLRIDMDSLEILAAPKISIIDSLPSGFYRGMTGGLSPAEYLDKIRGD